MIWVSVGYFVFFVLIVTVERHRVRGKNAYDLLTLFWIMFVLQAVIPPLIITAILGLHGNVVTGVAFYNRVLWALDPSIALDILLLSVLFWIAICVSWFALGEVYIGRDSEENYRFAQFLLPYRWIIAMAFGVSLVFFLLGTMGGGLSGLENLVLLRGGSLGQPSVESLHLFYGFTPAFGFLSMLGVVRYASRRNYLLMSGCILLALFFGITSVARRAIVVEVIFLYFTYILLTGKLHLKYLVISSLPLMLLVLFGKTALNLFAMTGTFSFSAIAAYAPQLDLWSSIVRIFADIGRTVTESWATFLYLHIPPRFGVDHILSVVRLLSGNTLGLNMHLPERIVRISTETFISASAQDEPPGLMGQMWLDFRAFGPIIWGIILAFQLATLQRIYNRCRKTPEIVTLYIILLYVMILVINSGSYDFTFSINWCMLLLLSLLVVGHATWTPHSRKIL